MVNGQEIYQAATSKTTLGAVMGLLGERVVEKYAFENARSVFGYAKYQPDGRLTFHEPKPNPDPSKGGIVPQTAESSRMGLHRQLARGTVFAAGMYVAATAKSEFARGAAFGAGITAAAHIVQDLFPQLR